MTRLSQLTQASHAEDLVADLCSSVNHAKSGEELDDTPRVINDWEYRYQEPLSVYLARNSNALMISTYMKDGTKYYYAC